MRRAVASALLLSGCVFDYDGAFERGAGGGGGNASSTSETSASSTQATGGSTSTTTDTATSADTSTSTGAVCVCAPPGSCDEAGQCICPASVVIDRYPTIGEGTNAGNQGWTDVGFAAAPDGSAASVHLGNNQASEQLTVRGFDFGAIPNDATITGIHVDVDRCRSVEQSPVNVHDTYLSLVSGGAAIGAGPALQTWGMCGGAGGSYELPVNGIGPAQLQNDFGIAMRIKNEATGQATGYVNTFHVTVTYHPTCVP